MEKSSDNGLLIRHECPQCGAPITLLEDDRMFCCAYCRVKLFLSGRDFFRFTIPPAEDVQGEIFYVPYWRFKGLAYTVVPFEVSGKYMDQTSLAFGSGSFPATLGFRTQVLTLRFLSPDAAGRFLPTNVPISDAFTLVEGHAGGDANMLHHAFVGRTASMIYAPVYDRDGTIYDAVLKRPLSARTPAIAEALRTAATRADWSVEFLSTLCPECGWQLTGENESAIFICGNCVSVWEVSGGALRRVECIIAPGGDEGLFYAPFWRISVGTKVIDLRTYGDFARAVNLPKAIKPEWERQELFFWFPAFKTSPDYFLRIATLLTIDQPQVVNDEKRIWTGRQSFAAVSLRAQEAANGLKAALAKIAPKKLYPDLPAAELTLKNAQIVLLPFRQTGAEFVEVNLNFRMPRNVFITNRA
ncbi:MAG TPA: hypothetical protein VL197_10850 [Nitrospirota bacterium]|nr:hypothetical protein [Nitrospirota bacterium]